MIAAELAVHLGADLGLDSVGDGLGRDRAAGPGLPGITRAVLDAPGAGRRRRGPADGQRRSIARPPAGPPRSIPIAVPGVRVGRAPGGAAPGRPGRVARRPVTAPSRAGCTDGAGDGDGPARARRR